MKSHSEILWCLSGLGSHQGQGTLGSLREKRVEDRWKWEKVVGSRQELEGEATTASPWLKLGVSAGLLSWLWGQQTPSVILLRLEEVGGQVWSPHWSPGLVVWLGMGALRRGLRWGCASLVGLISAPQPTPSPALGLCAPSEGLGVLLWPSSRVRRDCGSTRSPIRRVSKPITPASLTWHAQLGSIRRSPATSSAFCSGISALFVNQLNLWIWI